MEKFIAMGKIAKRKKSIIACLFILLSFVSVAACGVKKEQSQYAKLAIYSAEQGSLLKTIDEEAALLEFEKHIGSLREQADDSTALSSNLPEGLKAEYVFKLYKRSVAKIGGKAPEHIFDIICYSNSNYLTMNVAPDAVKNIKGIEEFLSFNFEMPLEDVDYLRSLAS